MVDVRRSVVNFHGSDFLALKGVGGCGGVNG